MIKDPLSLMMILPSPACTAATCRAWSSFEVVGVLERGAGVLPFVQSGQVDVESCWTSTCRT